MARPGVYFRVLVPGLIAIGDVLQPVARESVAVSVAEPLALDAGADAERDLPALILVVPEMPPSWRRPAEERLPAGGGGR